MARTATLAPLPLRPEPRYARHRHRRIVFAPRTPRPIVDDSLATDTVVMGCRTAHGRIGQADGRVVQWDEAYPFI